MSELRSNQSNVTAATVSQHLHFYTVPLLLLLLLLVVVVVVVVLLLLLLLLAATVLLLRMPRVLQSVRGAHEEKKAQERTRRSTPRDSSR
jgi:uncharacterized membrane protein